MQTEPTPHEYRSTRWKNNTNLSQRVDIHVDGQIRRHVWKPGEEKDLSSQYDQAIQRTHGDVIVGGLAPALTNISKPESERPVLHESLDVNATLRKTAEAEAMLAELNARRAADAAVVAQANAEVAKQPSREQKRS